MIQNFGLGTDLKHLNTQAMCLKLDSVKPLNSIDSHNDMTHKSIYTTAAFSTAESQLGPWGSSMLCTDHKKMHRMPATSI